jgi:hypothetical protein
MIEIIVPTVSRKEVEDYRKRLGNYIIAMTYFKKMLDEGEINVDQYSEIERKLLAKYRISEKSLKRMDLKSIAERDDWK